MKTTKMIDPTVPLSSPQRSWLEASGQGEKILALRLSPFLVLVALGLGKVADTFGLPPYVKEIISATGVILFIAGFLYPVLGITCRNCKGKVLVHYMNHSPFHRWFSDLHTATQCPRCGDDGQNGQS